MDEKTMEISNFREMKPENTTKKKPKILRHEEIMEQIHDTYIQKNSFVFI